MTEQGPEWSEIAGQVTTSETPHVIRSEQRAQQKLHDVTRLVSDWIWETDPDFRLTYVSPRVMESLGFHPLELLGCSLADLGDFAVAGSGPPAWRSPFREIPFEALDRSGKKRLLMLGGLPIFDPADGNFEGVRGSARDVTESRQAEHRLIAAKREAEFANLSKSEFLANMSHELRTPLNAILGFAQMIQAQTIGPDQGERYIQYAKDIYVSGSFLLAIINDILDLSKIEAGKVTLDERDLDIAEIVESAVRLVRARAGDGELGLTVDVFVEPAGKRLRADERIVRQMLLNLLSNAIKFTPAGGSVQLSARCREDGGMAFCVDDSGIGMTPEDITVALSSFGQVEGVLTRSAEGTGLGLPLVASLAELHDGSLELESQPGQGTRATINFPDYRLVEPATKN